MGAEESADARAEAVPAQPGVGRGLSSPLLITVVAAVLSGLLLPYIARGWQDHQKALEIKTGLVTQMSESSSGTVATSRFLAARLIPTTAGAAAHLEHGLPRLGDRELVDRREAAGLRVARDRRALAGSSATR